MRMLACATAHHWARELIGLGHQVRLMPPTYVKPYVKRNKTDAADAEAIAEAVIRPNMRFVAVKSVNRQRLCCTECANSWSASERCWRQRYGLTLPSSASSRPRASIG